MNLHESSLLIIAEVVESLLMLTPAERAIIARELAEADRGLADQFAGMLLDAGYEHCQKQAVQRMKRMVVSALTVEDDDIENQLRLA